MLNSATNLDHLVIAANNLEQGVAYIKQKLGVDIPYGGFHDMFGTHNHLMKLADDVFLEVIAINPDLPNPPHPRWFGLDDPYIQKQIEIEPRLLTWVVNTTDLNALLASSNIAMGVATPVTRGQLNWLFAVPDDGAVYAAGAVPYAMQWLTEWHPAINMADTGCTLSRLEIHHDRAEWLQGVLESIGAADLVTIVPRQNNGTMQLKATIRTPHGDVELSSL